MRLGLLLEQMFPEANIQMISSVISHHGTSRSNEFSRVNEFIYFVMIGDYSITPIDKSGYVVEGERIHWQSFRRSNPSNVRASRPSQFYPLYIDKTTRKIVEVGDPITPDVDRFSVKQLPNCETVFPVRDDGTEMMWSLLPEVCREKVAKGYLRVGRYTPAKPQQFVIQYLMFGTIKAIEDGSISVTGYEKDGSVVAQITSQSCLCQRRSGTTRPTTPGTMGRKSLNRLWEMEGSISPNPSMRSETASNSLPGTTLTPSSSTSSPVRHDVARRQSAERRRWRASPLHLCNEQRGLCRRGEQVYRRGPSAGRPRMGGRGIAHYVTWPRTKCSIEGVDSERQPAEGQLSGSDSRVRRL